MANFFYVYEDFGSNRRLKGMYTTQDKADSEATGDVSLTANQGAVDIPDNVSVGWIWDITDTKWRETLITDLSELDQKKAAAQAHHDQLLEWAIGVAYVAHEKPQIDVSRAYQFLAMAHWANYLIAHMTSITLAQFVAWSQAASMGSSDLTTVQSYFEKAHELMERAKVPLEACTWANPTTATRVKLDEARDKSTDNGTPIAASYFNGETFDLTNITLGNGAWIQELTS